MSEFAVRVKRINTPVLDHPNADRLTIIKIDDYDCISAKLDDGSHRYKEGDYVVYVPENTVVPEWALKRYGFWKEADNTGMLAGSKGDRVKAIRLRGIFSQGLLFPVITEVVDGSTVYRVETEHTLHLIATDTLPYGLPDIPADPEDVDVAEILGLTKYEPKIPTHMSGEVCRAFVSNGEKQYAGDITMGYDFEDIKKVNYLFDEGEEVVATEKLHGSCILIGIVPGFYNEEFFGNGSLFVGSKGLSKSGIVFKNNEANDANVYVKALRAEIAKGFDKAIEKLSVDHDNTTVHVFGEVFGKGIQDLTYDTTEPQFKVFEIAINRQFLAYDDYVEAAAALGVDTVPLIYRGPFIKSVLEEHRDGKTTLGGKHIREGLVVRAANGGRKGQRRKIAKMVSPDYLLRKNKDATEYN